MHDINSTSYDSISYGRNQDGTVMWQVRVLGLVAKLLRVQFKIGGQPYGARYEKAINRAWERSNRGGLSRGSCKSDTEGNRIGRTETGGLK